MPFGGIKIVEKSCEAYGRKVDPEVDENGNQLSVYSEPTPCKPLGNRSAEMDPAVIWRIVKKGLKCVSSSVNGVIRSIGVSSMGESGVLCDEDGRPLYPFIVWYDVRPQKMLEKFMISSYL